MNYQSNLLPSREYIAFNLFLLGHPKPKKRRFWTQDTKKVGCQAKMVVRKVKLYPDFAITNFVKKTDTDYKVSIDNMKRSLYKVSF